MGRVLQLPSDSNFVDNRHPRLDANRRQKDSVTVSFLNSASGHSTTGSNIHGYPHVRLEDHSKAGVLFFYSRCYLTISHPGRNGYISKLPSMLMEMKGRVSGYRLIRELKLFRGCKISQSVIPTYSTERRRRGGGVSDTTCPNVENPCNGTAA